MRGTGALAVGLALLSCGDKTTELIRQRRTDAGPQLDATRETGPGPVCAGNMECPLALSRCNLQTGVCEPCADDSSCRASAPRCHLASGACVECLDNADCRNRPCDNEECLEADLCETARSRCVECTTDGHCDGDETCSAALGECATPCSSREDCPFDEPLCDPAIGFCVECREDRDCLAGQTCRASECRL